MRSGIRVVLLACCASLLPANEQISRDFQKTVALPSGRSLRVEHQQGDVTIHARPKGDVEVSASIKCSSQRPEDARDGCDRIRVLVEENGSGVLVRTQLPDSDFFNGRRRFSWSIHLDIAMPDTAPLDVRTHFGSVTVTDLHAPAVITDNNGKVSLTGGRGRQRIENSFGDVEAMRVDGDVTIVNSNGRVNASDITGALDVRNNFGETVVVNVGKRLDVNSGNGNVTAANVTGPVNITDSFGAVTVRDSKADVWVQNQNGAVEVTNAAGTADLRTSFGPVRFSRIGKGVTVHAQNSDITGDTVGGPAAADTNFGGIEIHHVKGSAHATGANSSIRLSDIEGEVYAKTSFGGVTVEDVADPITVDNQNGSITVRAKAGKRCAPIALTTNFGPIKVNVAPGMGYDVTARVSFGHISSEPPITATGQLGGDNLTGKIGGGGCMLKLNDQNGNIDIAK